MTENPITTQTLEEGPTRDSELFAYSDTMVKGTTVTTVNAKDDVIEVYVYDPNDPGDAIAEFEFERT